MSATATGEAAATGATASRGTALGDAAVSKTVVGFVGLGTMGGPMAARLAACGRTVVAFDLDEQRRAQAAEAGCVVASTLAALGREATVVITMLPTSAVVHQALLGPGDAVLRGDPRATVVIDMSSSSPPDTTRLAADLAERGIQVADAPVSGRRAKAASGELTVMVGADDALLAHIRPVLEPMASRIFHVGPTGAGHAAKALNNLLSAVGLLAAGEVLVAGVRLGVKPGVLLEVLNASSGRNHATEVKYAAHILNRAFDSGFALDLMLKDLGIAMDALTDLDLPRSVAHAAVTVARTAREELGQGQDHTDAVRWLERRAGVELR